MSKYTTQLRWIVEQIGQGLEVPEGQEYANAVYKYIGLNKYPIFDESYRTGLNDKIIDHFFFREIGFETAAQFAFYLKRTMNEIMPKYNALYTAQLTMDTNNPLSDFTRHKLEQWKSHVDDDSTSETESTDNTTTSVATHDRNVYQDTPMSMLSNSGSPNIENLDYATNVTYDDGTTNSTSNRVGSVDGSTVRDRDDTGQRTHDDYGNDRSWAALMEEYAEKWVNIDMLVIADLEDLFMGIW